MSAAKLRDPTTAADFGIPPEWVECAENYANWRAQQERERCIARVQAEIDHAVINDHRLTPSFGRRGGDPAVRVGNVDAALDAIRARGTP